MATFVEITPDAFSNTFKAASKVQAQTGTWEDVPNNTLGLYHHVRRPVRGIEIKNETYATIQVRRSDGQAIPLFDAGSEGGTVIRNSNFLMQSVTEQRAEKQQVVITFGEPYIFFFGEQPRMITCSGVLLNTVDFNWRAEWWKNYDLYLRGTACVRSRTRVYLSWDDIIVEGYVLQANAQEDASNNNIVQLQFQMFLTNYENISSIGDSFAHLAGKDINLDPQQTELLTDTGSVQSTTLGVRQANQALASQLAAGAGSQSLLENLRDGAVAALTASGTGSLVEVNGQVLDVLSAASDFVSGRNIRVPVGFEGSSVFDDAQIALGSVADSVITGQDRTISISSQIAGHTFNITGALGQKTLPAKYGGLFLNEDEFVARTGTSPSTKVSPPPLDPAQLQDTNTAADQARKAFQEFGVPIDTPDDVRLLIGKGLFGIASVAVGAELNKVTSESGTARFASNLL